MQGRRTELHFRPDIPDNYFQGRADEYVALEEAPWQLLRHKVIVENLDRHLAPHHRSWIDVGAGDGKLAAYLAAGGRNVTLVEPATDLLASAERRLTEAGLLDRCTLVSGTVDWAALMAPAADFAGLSLHNVLEYTPDWRAALALSVGPLPPGSLVSVVFSNIYGQLVAEAGRGTPARELAARLRSRSLVVGLAGSRFPRPALYSEEVEQQLAHSDVTVVGRYGVRVLSDLIGQPETEDAPPTPADLLELELAVTDDPVLHRVARHIHLVGVKA
ncbi:methyltransferase domain-containing protein [Micromonospora inyonensis]|uniref:S-adenosylmethionine-dependent methyltransferase n=1 Tax=Micromonospora inyonensis TaxID=47866 RepID=A0A1C6RLH8_9ACTN|nr:methyltransferase domain-containing protein [Micromonospora inyonensis]SCL18032.1 S-adenosylmethionine-dependent methyltransferase [Micromonospora inyonensis]